MFGIFVNVKKIDWMVNNLTTGTGKAVVLGTMGGEGESGERGGRQRESGRERERG